mgnify:CR=1 FL=1
MRRRRRHHDRTWHSTTAVQCHQTVRMERTVLRRKHDEDWGVQCGCWKGRLSLGYHCVGFDISNNLLDICKNKGLNVYYQDVLNLKNNNKYNKIISIAVLHHLQTLEEQIAAIKNLCDCLDNNGKLLVSFWSKEKTFDDIKTFLRIIDLSPIELNGPI